MKFTLSGFVFVLIVLVVLSVLMARTYEVGPIIWIKRACRRKRALEGTDRRELVARIQQLLPQANDDNVLFSLHLERSTHSGSKVTVTSTTYYYMVFVADGDCFWVIPMSYDRRRRSYQLGTPVPFSADVVKQVRLTGKRGKTLTFHFLLEVGDQQQEINMDLTSFHFRKNSFYPFDLMQETACNNAQQLAEKMASTACNLTPEDLELGRKKDECSDYGIYAACAGFFGIMFASAELLPVVLACFAISLILFAVMIAKKQFPKASAVVVLIEAVVAYMLMR